MSKYPSLLPALGAAALLVTGLALLVPGTPTSHGHTRAATSTAATEQPPTPPDQSTPAPANTTPHAPAPTRTPAPTVTSAPEPTNTSPAGQIPSGAPAAGDGPAGDPAVQAAFTADHPSDLAPADAAQLNSEAGAVWLAETTGSGRNRWPDYFPTGLAAAPPLFYSGVRIQATAVHTERGSADRVRVDLLWTGTSASGEYGDRRPATVHFARINGTWEPVR